MSNQVDESTLATFKIKLIALGKAVQQLGPIEELWQRANTIFQQSSPNVRVALEKSREIREKITKLLEEPKCEYDDMVASFADELLSLPATLRTAMRDLIGQKERSTLSAYVSRADFLALEESSERRVLSGLIIQALIMPDGEDRSEVRAAIAPAWFVANKLGLDKAKLFDEGASFAAPSVAKVFKEFGQEQNVDLATFGLQMFDTPSGPRFRQMII
jgi:hypothetical protein